MIDAVSGVGPHGSVSEGSGGKATKDGELSSNSHGESKREYYRRLVVDPDNVPRSAMRSVVPASPRGDFG